MDSLKIVFMGTPAFAVASLKGLLDAGFHVAAVITAPDRAAGRGMRMQASDVKKFASQRNIPVLQPTNLKSPEFVRQLREINPDLQVVVAFRMLPEVVWNLPPLGTINLHASLLPQYRGAAPINHAIIRGEKETGVTTFKLKHDIDTGNILMQEKIAILPEDDAGSMHDKLMDLGARVLVKTVAGIADGSLKEISQDTLADPAALHHAPKLFREYCLIDWNHSVDHVYNFIRGLSPQPGAFTFLKETRIIVTKAEKDLTPPTIPAGEYSTDRKSFLKVAATDGYIRIMRLKPEGKGEMAIDDFLRGKRDL